jgi:hypothetical protein
MYRTTFRHIPLTRPAEQTRLLKLQPDIDVIRLNIQTYELAECPKFVALSYEWGNCSDMYDIIIDGAVFKIRQNLRDALEHIRTLQADTSSTRLFDHDSPSFWIDAIAIDQSNDREKPHQVSIMGKIYRQASHVVAWLGLEQGDDCSGLALDYLSTGPKVSSGYIMIIQTHSHSRQRKGRSANCVTDRTSSACGLSRSVFLPKSFT